MISAFQSTSPTGEDTITAGCYTVIHRQFQSTSPTGEDTTINERIRYLRKISIHFPHRGRHTAEKDTSPHNHISIHFPHRGRHGWLISGIYIDAAFQSTSPTGEDTPVTQPFPFPIIISIHFPHRGRHYINVKLSIAQNISIHFPHRGRHNGYNCRHPKQEEFQSTSPTGEDTRGGGSCRCPP